MTWNYIAGFFDGEGSIGHNGKGYRLTIPQTSYLVLEEIKNFTKKGDIIKTVKRKSHWKDNWVYYVARQKDVQIFLKKLLPHLIVKRKLAEQTILKLNLIVEAQKQKSLLAVFRKKQSILLRNNGLSYRQIGRKIGIDWGYARRLALNKK